MDRTPPTLDMRLDGSFRQPKRLGVPVSAQLMLGAILVAVCAGAIAFAALALWVLSMMLPVLIGAAVFAWGLLKFRQFQARRGRNLRPF